MSAGRVADRVRELGSVGEVLFSHLHSSDEGVIDLPVTAQFYETSVIARTDPIRAAAMSILVCDFSTQVVLKKDQLLQLFPWSQKVEEVRSKYHSFGGFLDGQAKTCLPLKSHPGARNKVNVYFSEIWSELLSTNPLLAERLLKEEWRLGGLYDDQASALVLYTHALEQHYGVDALDLATYFLHYTKDAKSVSTVLKSLGANGSLEGALLCEANTLVGRGVGSIVFDEEVGYRLDEVRVKEKVVNFDSEKLRAAVRKVISRELGSDIQFDELDDYWSKRWAWCVNGAHGNALGRLKPQYKTKFLKRMHRRVFAENLEHEPISSWSGESFFTMSEKLEHGKTRAIFGGDSVSYFCFDHLLRPIEKSWRGNRVVLDPGKGGAMGMARRVEGLKGAWHVMMDYDDFNSQHSLEAQSIVIRELVSASGYDAVRGELLAQSFFRQYVSHEGGVSHLKGTLMSGHRATTMINSVLNLAYILVACPDIFNECSIHVGDDIYIKTSSAAVAADILKRVEACGVRMNPLKQSIGTETAEFLRHASGPRGSYGYVARSISSVVSGNWVSEAKLGAREFIGSLVQSSWTLMNRSCSDVAVLLSRAVNRVLGIKLSLARKLMLGEVSLDGSPVRGKVWKTQTLRSVVVTGKQESRVRVEEVRGLGGEIFATTDYVSNHVSPVEVMAVEETGTDLTQIMVESSYKKTLLDANTVVPEVVHIVTDADAWRPKSASEYSEIKRQRVEGLGVLLKYPLLNLMRSRLDDSVLLKLLTAEGADFLSGYTLEELAFGESDKKGRVWVIGAIPYSDARGLAIHEDTGVYATRNRYF